MRIGRMPDQIVRLAFLFLLAVVAMILIRSRFVPESFGERGHYRAASIDTIAGQDIKYAGWQVCVECHEEEGEAKTQSYHRTLSCEVCHGPARNHAEDPASHRPVIPRERGAACLYCHSYLPSRPTGFPQILERIHNPMEPCVACHNPHAPSPPELPESCSACHAQIARVKAISHHHGVDCQTCHQAVPEHRENPRAFLPKKPTESNFCLGCHGIGADSASHIPRIEADTHGGNYLCWQCHYPHFPES